MSEQFEIGELAWHTALGAVVKIAGPLETVKNYLDIYGNLICEPLTAYRAVARGKGWICRPHCLRKLQPFTASSWLDVRLSTGWRPA